MPSWRGLLRHREPQAPKVYVLPARAIVVVAGLLIAVNGVLLLSAGWVGSSWGLIIIGALAVPPAVLVVRTGLASPREGFCNAPVVFVTELLFRILG